VLRTAGWCGRAAGVAAAYHSPRLSDLDGALIHADARP
jgi:hypothetical protein